MFGSLRNNSNEHSNKSRRDDDNTMDNKQNNKLLSKLNRWFYRGITCHVLSKNHAQTVILEEKDPVYHTEAPPTTTKRRQIAINTTAPPLSTPGNIDQN